MPLRHVDPEAKGKDDDNDRCEPTDAEPLAARLRGLGSCASSPSQLPRNVCNGRHRPHRPEPSSRALVSLPMQKRAILFDIDGTLVDSNDAHVEAWQRAFAAEGYAFSRAEIHGQIGKGGDNLVPSLLPEVSVEVQERLAAAEGETYKRDFMTRVEPLDGASEVLKNLAERGHTLILASSASRAEVDFYVDLLDADGLISGTTSKDDVPHSKPCPDIFTAALALTGGPAASAIVIGDTPYDVLAARRAGIEAIAVLSGGFAREELASCGPVAIYESVADIEGNYETSPIATDRRRLPPNSCGHRL